MTIRLCFCGNWIDKRGYKRHRQTCVFWLATKAQEMDDFRLPSKLDLRRDQDLPKGCTCRSGSTDGPYPCLVCWRVARCPFPPNLVRQCSCARYVMVADWKQHVQECELARQVDFRIKAEIQADLFGTDPAA